MLAVNSKRIAAIFQRGTNINQAKSLLVTFKQHQWIYDSTNSFELQTFSTLNMLSHWDKFVAQNAWTHQNSTISITVRTFKFLILTLSSIYLLFLYVAYFFVSCYILYFGSAFCSACFTLYVSHAVWKFNLSSILTRNGCTVRVQSEKKKTNSDIRMVFCWMCGSYIN